MLNVVIKGDGDSSAHALADSLARVATVVHRGAGAIDEDDVERAAGVGGMIVGFHVRPSTAVRAEAAVRGVEIRLYDTINEAVTDIGSMTGAARSPALPMELGVAEVRKTLPRGLETVAVCTVTEGSLRRNAVLRVFRDGVQVYDGRPTHLRRGGNEVDVVGHGQEFELAFEYFQELRAGDVLECFAARR